MSYVTRHEIYLAAINSMNANDTVAFKARQLRPYLDCSGSAICQHLTRMAHEGHVVRVRHGLYALTGLFDAPEVDPRVHELEVEDTEDTEVDVIDTLQSARLTHATRLDDLRSAYDEAVISERLSFQSQILEILDGQQ